MNSKDLEKMFEVIVSLEPTSPRPSRMEENLSNCPQGSILSDIENIRTYSESKKSSMPLNVVPPSIRRGSLETRKSLFQNERGPPNSNNRRMTLFRANSNMLSKVAQETHVVEFTDEEPIELPSSEGVAKDDHVYEKVSFPKETDDLKRQSHEIEPNSRPHRDTLTSLNIDCRSSLNPNQRSSLEITNKKELRCSNLSESACQSRSVDEQNNKMKQQSAPESARNSALNPQLSPKDNQSSIDSGVDQTVSIGQRSFQSNEVTNSFESFSDISESNVTSVVEKDFSYINNETSETKTWISKPPVVTTNADAAERGTESPQLKVVPVIKSEEEKNKFLRMISNEISLNSFATKEIIKFFRRDGAFSSHIIDKFQIAYSVCCTLKQKYQVPKESFCQVVEIITKESLERTLEDHENILDVFYSWGSENHNNKFIFQECPSMYRIFIEPSKFMNEMKVDFEITDAMCVKAVNSKWVQASCFIKDCNIYFTSKKGSKDHKDTYILVNLKEVDYYTSSNPKMIKKEFKCPTADLIVFKENKLNHKPQENAYIAVQNSQQKERWIEAIKVAKYTFNQLKNNFMEYQMSFTSGSRSQSASTVTDEETHHQFEPCSI